MPFEWYKPTVNKNYEASFAAKTDDAYRLEIKKRAELLKNLGYKKEYAIYRIKSNVAWEFELSKVPVVFKEIDPIVDKVYA